MMRLKIFYKILRSQTIKPFLAKALSIFGFIWLFLEPLYNFMPNQMDEIVSSSWISIYFFLVILSCIIAIFKVFSGIKFSEILSSPDVEIEIKVGDLFDQTDDLVIGFSDFFDTSLENNIISSTSVQAQFLNKIYLNDIGKLDDDIDAKLSKLQSVGSAPNKVAGKQIRYSIGTVIVISKNLLNYYLAVYGSLEDDLYTQSDPQIIWDTLENLWEKIRRNSMGHPISMPVIGSELARTGLPRMALIMMIIISFITASKKDFVTKKLSIIIHPGDLKHINLLELKNILKSSVF